jgi:hypothetical protein
MQSAKIEDQFDSILVSYTSPTQSVSFNLSQTQLSISNNFIGVTNSSVSLGTSGFTNVQASISLNASLMYSQSLGVSSSGSVDYSSISLIQKTGLSKVAVVGANGIESNVDSSKTVTLSFFYNINQKLNVNSLSTPISITIPKSDSLNVTGFQSITLSSLSSLTCNYNDLFVQYTVTIKQSNSIHIQIKQTQGLGYLVLLKFGSAPKLNLTYSNYDLWKLYCPNDVVTQLNETFHLFFVNTATVNGFNGNVGYAIRELTSAEMKSYCSWKGTSKYKKTTPPKIKVAAKSSNSSTNSSSTCKSITSDFKLRTFLSGCYFMNTSTGYYENNGTEVMISTSVNSTVCQVTHCTEFAGGFIVTPNTINFDTVWANASIGQNPILYATVFTIIGLYFVLAVLCRLMDVRDRNKKGVTLLNENRIDNLYEIILFTGNRRNAGTDSNVFLMMNGKDENSHVIGLKDKQRKLFRRGGFDTFIVSTDQALGDLVCIRVWHDNSGKSMHAANWYLKHVVIHDLTTQNKFVFICERWFAVELDDGKVERVLPSAGQKERSDLKYLIKKQTKDKLSDSHLWFSLIARPVPNAFGRLDRLTCIFVLLCLTMLTNLMFYGSSGSSLNPNALNIGPFTITPEQIGIGVATNLIVFPVSFIIMQLFRRSRDRTQDKIDKSLNKPKKT